MSNEHDLNIDTDDIHFGPIDEDFEDDDVLEDDENLDDFNDLP